MIGSPASVFNVLEKELKACRKVSQELCSSIALRKEEYHLLSEQLNHANVPIEYEESRARTNFTQTFQRKKKASIFSAINQLVFFVRQVNKVEFSSPIEDSVLMLKGEMSRFGYLFSFKTTLSGFHKLHPSITWAPNSYTESVDLIRDCRERILNIGSFFSLGHYNVLYMRTMGTARIDCTELNHSQVHICVLYLSSCPIQQCSKGSFFRYTGSAMINFMERST